MSKKSKNKTKSPIEDIKEALKLMEEKGIYSPYNGKFPLSKEVYNYLMQDHVPILSPEKLERFQKESERAIWKDMRERWGLEKAVKKFLSKEFDLDDKDYELVWKSNHEVQT